MITSDYNYILTIKYPVGYFHDPNAELVRNVRCGGTKPKTQDQLQELYYTNCEILEFKQV